MRYMSSFEANIELDVGKFDTKKRLQTLALHWSESHSPHSYRILYVFRFPQTFEPDLTLPTRKVRRGDAFKETLLLSSNVCGVLGGVRDRRNIHD